MAPHERDFPSLIGPTCDSPGVWVCPGSVVNQTLGSPSCSRFDRPHLIIVVSTTTGDVRSRVVFFEAIWRDSRREGLLIRAMAEKHRVHRRTVRQALTSATPPEAARRQWQSRKIDPYSDAIDEMLRTDLTAPRKQRHTARRVLARLVEEHAAEGLSLSTVAQYVSGRRLEIAAETGHPVAEVFVPQTHQPGAEAEVDFAELWVDLLAGRTKCYLFTLRLCFSGRAVHRVFATQSQEAFLCRLPR